MIALVDGLIVYRLASVSQPFRDFAVLWTAGRVDPRFVYDPAFMTEAQRWYTSGIGYRPFAYPPTSLPWLYVFGHLSFWASAALWTVLSCTLFFIAARLLSSWRASCVALVAPMSAFAVAAGQTSLLVASAVIAAVSILKSRPIAAGVLIGLTATIKPQIVILAPLALIVSGQTKALAAAAVVGLGLVTFSVGVYGTGPWLDWLQSVVALRHIVAGSGYPALGATPSSIADLAGSTGIVRRIIVFGGLVMGGALVVSVWRGTRDDRYRIIALICGSVLCAPYDFIYDLAALAPPAIALLADRRGPINAWVLGALGLTIPVGAFTPPLISAFLLVLPRREGKSPQPQAP